jgi:hypothetical protein
MIKTSSKVKCKLDKVKENVKTTANDISEDIEDKDTEFITRGDIAGGTGSGKTGDGEKSKKERQRPE